MTKNINFEEAMKRLEEIVEKMENTDVNLDRSLTLFEEGIKLVRFCSVKLEDTKKKIEVLVKKGEKISKEPFGSSDKESNGEADLFK